MLSLQSKMWVTHCNIRMLQSVTPKTTTYPDYETQILIDSNKTCWACATKLDAPSNLKIFLKNSLMNDSSGTKLFFGTQTPQNGLKLKIISTTWTKLRSNSAKLCVNRTS